MHHRSAGRLQNDESPRPGKGRRRGLTDALGYPQAGKMNADASVWADATGQLEEISVA